MLYPKEAPVATNKVKGIAYKPGDNADIDATTLVRHSNKSDDVRSVLYRTEDTDKDPANKAKFGDTTAVEVNPGRGLLREYVLTVTKVSGTLRATVLMPVRTPHRNVTNTGPLTPERDEVVKETKEGDEAEADPNLGATIDAIIGKSHKV